MSTKFYWKEPQPNFDTLHIGHRSGAGAFCWECGTTLCVGGVNGIHYSKSKWYDHCPLCGGPPSDGCCTSFTWEQDPNEVKRVCKNNLSRIIIDEYNHEYTGEDFLKQLEQIPIFYVDLIRTPNGEIAKVGIYNHECIGLKPLFRANEGSSPRRIDRPSLSQSKKIPHSWEWRARYYSSEANLLTLREEHASLKEKYSEVLKERNEAINHEGDLQVALNQAEDDLQILQRQCQNLEDSLEGKQETIRMYEDMYMAVHRTLDILGASESRHTPDRIKSLVNSRNGVIEALTVQLLYLREKCSVPSQENKPRSREEYPSVGRPHDSEDHPTEGSPERKEYLLD